MIRYLKKEIENMRDIGGNENKYGKRVKTGRLIRSNLPIKLTDENLAYFKDKGIYTVMDLRSYEEIEKKPSIFEKDSKFKVHHIGMSIGKDIPKDSASVPKSYLEMVEVKDKIKKIFEIIEENEKLIYFCNAGKDRTGVISSLILQLLSVEDIDIINLLLSKIKTT